MERILLILRMRLVLSFFLFFICSNFLFAQQFFGTLPTHHHDEKCAAELIEKKQAEILGVYGTKEYFESWMKGKLEEQAEEPSLRTTQESIRLIPVVVHIIHNGTQIGEGANIPLSQIEAQMRTLNEDFRRQNADAANTPAQFLPVAADSRIEFILAQEDPNGLPTTGINRIVGFQDNYSPSDASLISSLSLWPPEEYLNIWVVPLTSPFIGYASFPISELPGLNFPPNTRETDGVTIDYRYFGSAGNTVSSSRGRTLTHEIGHFFGLRHIWGDGDCSVDDFVADTPNQDRPNSGCLTNPRFTCESRDMTENYMDYTSDPCMNLFTRGQVERMDVVLGFSTRRASLVNNRATTPPENLPSISLSLNEIIQPGDFFCETPIIPQIKVRNLGSSQITSVRVAVRANGSLAYNQTVLISLATGEIGTLILNPVSLNESGVNTFEVEITEINTISAADNASSNIIRSTPVLQPIVPLPYNYSAADFNNLWNVRNPDEGITWEPIALNIDNVQQDLVYINNFDYEKIGEMDYFISPQFNLTNISNAQLSFDLAHAPYPEDGLQDRLWIVVTTDCGNTINLFNSEYQREGVELQTIEPRREAYFPTSEIEFRKEIVNLSQYSGQGNIRIAFIAINGFGNNIFLKNLRVNTTEEFRYDLSIIELVSPGPIVDGSHSNEILELLNTGNLPISAFSLSRQLNNSPIQRFMGQGVSVLPGETRRVSLPKANLLDRTNRLQYTISRPNFDQNMQAVMFSRFIIQNEESISVPWRQNFNEGTLVPWQIINPENNLSSFNLINLSPSETPQRALELNNLVEGNSYWLGSPLFDLSRTNRASILFQKAYSHEGGNTRFKVLLSTDGGATYAHELLSQISQEIASVPGAAGVNPNNSEEFIREFVDLTPFTGRGNDNMRLAFVVDQVDENTNPIYLDDIELFLSSDPDPIIPVRGNSVIYPNPATDRFNIAFNLQRFENVNIQVISMSGQVVHDVDYPNTLNQTYTFSTQLFSKGVFVVKITSNSITETRRLIIR